MASAPALKIYTESGSYVGAVKEVMAAAVLVSLYGEGATIRLGHSKRDILWTQGIDGDAAESYDTTGLTMAKRAGSAAHLIRY